MAQSWIQLRALNVLVRKEYATIKEMKPSGIEANLFTYHLDGLIKDGYIKKIDRGKYTLTQKGLKLIGTFSTATNVAHENIKTVVVLYGKDDTGRILLFKWSRQPYMGRVSLLHDRMPFGKSLHDGVKSAVNDKLGADLSVEYMTSILVKIYNQKKLISHMNCLVYKVDVSKIKLPYTSRNGEAFLGFVENSNDILAGLEELVADIENLKYPKEFSLSF